MRKWLSILFIGTMFAFPSFAAAQSTVSLSNVSVELWPEYDQPSMLVIVDFQTAPDTNFPTEVTLRIPQTANLVAVATHATDGSLLNAKFDGPKDDGAWQSFTISMDANLAYRIEYYQPITFEGNKRIFSYLWDNVYSVNAFSIRVLEPLDTTSFSTVPRLSTISQENGVQYHGGTPTRLASGEQYSLELEYEKSTRTLVAPPPQGIQPSAPVDENTLGRVSLSNSLPYVIGGVGVIMIIGGLAYYWRAGGKSSRKSRRRSRSILESEENDTESYCPQCGTRARGGDRFCRVCGARLKHAEEK